MICVHKVWKLIGNNYDVIEKSWKEDILDSGSGNESRSIQSSNIIHMYHSKLLLI